MGYGELLRLQKKTFLQAEKHFRSSTCNGPVLKINIEKIRSESSSDLEVKAAYGTLLLNSELRIDHDIHLENCSKTMFKKNWYKCI